MIFLIDYSRHDRRIELHRFSDDQRELAEEARLDLELRLNREGHDREVVLLEAPDEETLRRTHGRYFKTLTELMLPGTSASSEHR